MQKNNGISEKKENVIQRERLRQRVTSGLLSPSRAYAARHFATSPGWDLQIDGAALFQPPAHQRVFEHPS